MVVLRLPVVSCRTDLVEWFLPGAEIISAEGAGKALDSGMGEGGRVGAMEQGVEFSNHDFVGEARGAIRCQSQTVTLACATALASRASCRRSG